MPYSVQAANMVFDYITEHIKTGLWLPGAKIETETQLCENLGVSRIAVRQAIEKLSALQVLRKVQGSGTYVESFEDASLLGLVYFPITIETMITVLEFRRMFDSYNVELFLNKCTDKEIDELAENFDEMRVAVEDKERFRTLDNHFHDLIARGTKNPIIIQISELLTDLLEAHQSALYNDIGPEHAIHYHSMILDCIKQRNAELAEIYARMHIENSIHILMQKQDILTAGVI